MYISNICYIIKQKKERGILMIFKWMNESEISIEGDFILKVKVSHDFKETYVVLCQDLVQVKMRKFSPF